MLSAAYLAPTGQRDASCSGLLYRWFFDIATRGRRKLSRHRQIATGWNKGRGRSEPDRTDAV